MVNSFITLYKHSYYEFTEKKSKFICNAFPIETEKDAQKYINNIKKKYFNATHNVFAYKLLNNIKKQTDDKEPFGTAGLPILRVIEKENITNILIIVTRYYGGTPLGKNGLIKAYTNAAKSILKNFNIITKYLMESITIICNYNFSQKIYNIILKKNHVLENVIYEDKVTFKTFIKYNYVNNFINDIINITNNNIKIEKSNKIYGFFINNKFYK